MTAKTIHDTAIVDGDVKIGKDVRIGPYSIITGNVEIGDKTDIGPYVQVTGNVKIGSNNRIFHSAYIGAPPQDVAYQDYNSFVEIGNNNIIREFVQIHRATHENEVTFLGNNCFLMGGVHLAHNVKVGNFVIVANYTVLAGYVEVDDYSFISGLCGFHQFAKVGKYVMIGGCSRISKDCPPFMLIEGNPPRVAGINVVGLRRREFSAERRAKIKKAYKILYRSGRNVTQAVEELKLNSDDDIQDIVRFIETSERGIIK